MALSWHILAMMGEFPPTIAMNHQMYGKVLNMHKSEVPELTITLSNLPN